MFAERNNPIIIDDDKEETFLVSPDSAETANPFEATRGEAATAPSTASVTDVVKVFDSKLVNTLFRHVGKMQDDVRNLRTELKSEYGEPTVSMISQLMKDSNSLSSFQKAVTLMQLLVHPKIAEPSALSSSSMSSFNKLLEDMKQSIVKYLENPSTFEERKGKASMLGKMGNKRGRPPKALETVEDDDTITKRRRMKRSLPSVDNADSQETKEEKRELTEGQESHEGHEGHESSSQTKAFALSTISTVSTIPKVVAKKVVPVKPFNIKAQVDYKYIPSSDESVIKIFLAVRFFKVNKDLPDDFGRNILKPKSVVAWQLVIPTARSKLYKLASPPFSAPTASASAKLPYEFLTWDKDTDCIQLPKVLIKNDQIALVLFFENDTSLSSIPLLIRLDNVNQSASLLKFDPKENPKEVVEKSSIRIGPEFEMLYTSGSEKLSLLKRHCDIKKYLEFGGSLVDYQHNKGITIGKEKLENYLKFMEGVKNKEARGLF